MANPQKHGFSLSHVMKEKKRGVGSSAALNNWQFGTSRSHSLTRSDHTDLSGDVS